MQPGSAYIQRITIGFVKPERIRKLNYKVEWWPVATEKSPPTSREVADVVQPKSTPKKQPSTKVASPSTKRPEPSKIQEKQPEKDVPLRECLLAHYPFNGNAEDASGYRRHGEVHGATLTDDKIGTPKSAYLFDGKDDYIEIPHTEGLNPQKGHTAAAWIKMTKAPRQNENTILSKFLSGRKHCYTLYVGRDRRPVAYTSGIRMGGKTVLKVGEWYHLAETWDGQKWQLYTNGKLDASVPCKNIAGDDQNIRIGRTGGPKTPAWFTGKIDDVRIYNYALTAAEIRDLYVKNSYPGDEIPLLKHKLLKEDVTDAAVIKRDILVTGDLSEASINALLRQLSVEFREEEAKRDKPRQIRVRLFASEKDYREGNLLATATMWGSKEGGMRSTVNKHVLMQLTKQKE